MKKLFTLLCLNALFLFSYAQCPLNNGGFENGLTGWNVIGDVQITGNALTGASAVQLCNAQTGINQVFATQPGKVYDVSYSYNKADDPGWTIFQIRTLDANWSPIELNGGNGTLYFDQGGIVQFTNGNYNPSSVQITTPPNAAWFQVSFWNQDGGCIAFDDIEVCESGTPPDDCTNDTEAPQISNCPADISNVASGQTNGLASWTPPTATDNCDTPTLSSTHFSGTYFPFGTTEVIYTATDNSNNSSTCSFNVTITPNNPTNGGNLVLISTRNPTIPQWSSGVVEFVLENLGPESIYDISVEFTFSDNVRLVGGNEYESYQNTPLDNSWTRNPIWRAGVVGQGGRKFIRFNVYSITNEPMYIYGQVLSATGADSNSTPGNGTPPTPNEDDEAVANINGGTTPGTPDLQMGSFIIGGSLTQGENFLSNFNFQNIGDGSVTSPFALKVYLSTDRIPSNDDLVVGNYSHTVLPFDAGETNAAQIVIAIPNNAPVGNYFLIYKVDADNAIAESNENNNESSRNFEVTVATNDKPDLTISNLVLDNLSVKTGEVLNYNFDISNIGTANVPQNFIVRAYLSTDGDISADDIQDGIVPTGNFDAGLLVQDVPGASTINLPEGQYYLILKVDADDEVNESDETNNEIQANIQFTVDNSTGGGGSNCDVELGQDVTSFNCIEEIPGTNNIRVIYNNQNDVVEKILNSNLDEIGSMTNPYPVPDKLVLDEVTLTKTDGDGNVIYTRTIPQTLADRFLYSMEVIEFMGGFAFFGWVGTTNAPELKGLKTDSNFNVLLEKDMVPTASLGRDYVRSFKVVNGNNIAFLSGFNITFRTSATLNLWDQNLNKLDDLVLFSGAWQGGSNFVENSCRKFTVTDGIGLGFCKSGGCYRSQTKDVEFINNEINVNFASSVEHRTQLGIGFENYDWSANTTDGGRVTANRNKNLTGFPNPVPEDAQVIFKKYDAANTLQWEKNYLITDWRFVQRIYETNGTIYIVKNVSGLMSISELDCYDLPADLPDLVITDLAAPNTVSVGGSMPISYNLSNIGTANAGLSDISLYFSSDDRLGFDILIENIQSGGVAPGSGLSKSTTTTIPYSSPGQYFLLVVADASSDIAESNEDNNLIAYPFTLVENAGGVDLEISVNPLNQSPAQWSIFTTTVTLTNTGGATATGVEVEFRPTPAGAVYQGGNEGTVSQGTFKSWENIWDVGTLAAGESATLDVNMFRISASQFTMYTQVVAQNEPDEDSTPNNGVCCGAGEDDEKAFGIGDAVNSVSNRSSIIQNIDNQPFAIVNAMPNPFSERFNLEVYSNENQTSEVTIVDMLGRPVLQKAVFLQKGHNTIPVELDNSAAGMMTVKMTPFHPYLRQIRVMRVRE